MSEAPSLTDLLVTYREDLVAYLGREAGGLLRFESADDLAQAVHMRLFEGAEGFEYRGEKAFLALLHKVARAVVADRHDYWSAMKRGSGRILRITTRLTGNPVGQLPAGATGPATFASRRELLVLSARALAVLPDRDRKLVRWAGEGVPLGVQAERLEVSYAAAQRAGLRAMERFRKAFQLISKSSH